MIQRPRFSCGRPRPPAASSLLDRASATELVQRGADEGDRGRKVPHSERRRDAKDMVAEAPNVPVPALVGTRAPRMNPPVNFHDELDGRSGEVRHVPLTEHDLPTEGDAETVATKLFPEPAFWFWGVDPHVPGARSKQLPTSDADGANGLEHDVLLVPGMGPGAAPAERRIRDARGAPWFAPSRRAARSVRVLAKPGPVLGARSPVRQAPLVIACIHEHRGPNA